LSLSALVIGPSSPWRSLLLALAEMVAEASYDLLEWNVKGLGDSQQGGDGDGASGLNHLPVTRTEAAGEHVLLAQVAVVSVGSNPVAQGAEEPRVTGGEFSAGAHSSRVRPARAKIPRANIRIVRYTETEGREANGTVREVAPVVELAGPVPIGALVRPGRGHVRSLDSFPLPPPPVCDSGEAPFPPGLCVYVPRAADSPGRNVGGVERKSSEETNQRGLAEEEAGCE
jgi:hypothetical protein